MNPKPNPFLNAVIMFAALLFLGYVVIEAIPLGYTEGAILFLAAVVGAGLYWIGKNIENNQR